MYISPTLVAFFTKNVITGPMEKKTNKNGLRSRKLIRQALLSLLKTKNPDDITIKDIVDEANINRATFYAHYSCLRDEELEENE